MFFLVQVLLNPTKYAICWQETMPADRKGVVDDHVGEGCPSQSAQHSRHIQVFILPVTGVTNKGAG